MPLSKKWTDPQSGATKTAKEWAKSLGIAVSNFNWRLENWGENDSRVYQPSKKEHSRKYAQPRVYQHPVTGEIKSLSDWGKFLGLPPGTIQQRYSRYGAEDVRVYEPGFRPRAGGKPKGYKHAKTWGRINTIFVKHPTTLEVKTIKEWAEILELSPEVILYRYENFGEQDARVLSPKKLRKQKEQ